MSVDEPLSRPEQPLEITEEVVVVPIPFDSSCMLEITAVNPWSREVHLPAPFVLPHQHAKSLHELLGQYLARQQVYDKEFRNPSE